MLASMFILLLCVVLSCMTTHGLRVVGRRPSICRPRATRLRSSWHDATTALIAVGDYAAEIENAVGEEIYSPIFKSGLLLFGSGVISAFIAAFIVSKSDAWDDLGNEFEQGKIKQLIELDAQPGGMIDAASTSATAVSATPGSPSLSAPASASNAATDKGAVSAEVKGFDL